MTSWLVIFRVFFFAPPPPPPTDPKSEEKKSRKPTNKNSDLNKAFRIKMLKLRNFEFLIFYLYIFTFWFLPYLWTQVSDVW